MPQTFSDDKKIYSVDMMFSYIDIFGPKAQNIEVKKLIKNLEFDGWGDPEKNIHYSPLDVLEDPTNKKYMDDIKRIENADLKYPIIVYNNFVVDGVHRLTKSYLLKKKNIKAYVFSSALMNKFLINNRRTKEYDLITLFFQRFCFKPI